MSGRSVFLQPQTLLVPIGISFYTLEAVGYMADVYWGRIHAEKNWAKIALFLGFFPQIMVRGMRLLMHSGNVHQYAWKILHRGPYVLYGECSRRS